MRITHAPTLVSAVQQVARMKLICEMYLEVYNWLEQLEATVRQAYDWRDDLERGDESNSVSPPPVFQAVTPEVGFIRAHFFEDNENVGQYSDIVKCYAFIN